MDSNKKNLITPQLDEQLCRRIRGLLNRLTSSNLMAISTEIESLLKTNNYHQIKSCLCKCMDDLLIRQASLSPQRLISENAMLVAVLHCNIGDEIGGQSLHYFLNKFDHLNSQHQEQNHIESKELDNTVAFICYLCACNIMDLNLMFDIIDKIYSKFSAKSVELILLILKLIGFILRRGDPVRMRDMILNVQKASQDFQAQDKRIQFMLEAINAVKNNNLNKLNSIEAGPLCQVDIQLLKNTLKNGIKNKLSVTRLPGKYDAVLSSNRWWIKADPYLVGEQEEKAAKRKRETSSTKPELDSSSESLCKKLRFVTPLRKTIFKAIVTCEDYIECCQRLVKIGGRNFLEVANVCLILAQKEKKFNPFYIYLLDQLASSDRKYKIAVVYSLRDRLKDLEKLKKIERENIAKLIVELIKKETIPITLLKAIQLSDLDYIYMQFLRSILDPLFSLEEDKLIRILSKIKPKDPFAKALKLFVSCFVDPSCDITAAFEIVYGHNMLPSI